MTAYDPRMRHGRRIAFAAATAFVLVLVGVVPLMWGGASHTTFYTRAEVKLAATRAGLRIASIGSFPARSPYDHMPRPEHTPRTYIFRSRGLIKIGPRSHTALFYVYVVEYQPKLDPVWNRRVLRGALKGYNWGAAHFPKQFHAQRANVTVVGRRGLTPELRDQLVRTLRGLPKHGDPTVVG